MRKLVLALGTSFLAILLAACGQQQLPNVTLPSEVNGTVVDMLGGGVGGKNVAVGNKITVTASDGTFTLENIESPYDLVTYSADVGHVFEGLSSAAPAVLPVDGLLVGTPVPMNTATIGGTFATSVPAGHVAQVCLEGIDVPVYGCTDVAELATTYSNLTATWTEDGAADVRVHVLFVAVDADGLPTGYAAYGTATGTVVADGTPTIDVTPGGAPAVDTVNVSVTVPGGLALDTLAGAVRLSADLVLPVFYVSGALPTDVTLPMPRLGQESYQFMAQAFEPVGSGAGITWVHDVAAAGSTTLAIPAPPNLTTPADGATGITGSTPFTMDVASDGVNTFVFDGPKALAVTTTAKTTTIPDLSLYGLPLQPASTYDAQFVHVPGADAAESTTAWIGDYVEALLGFQAGGPGARSDGSIGADSISVTTE